MPPNQWDVANAETEPGEQEQPSSTVDPSSPKPDSFQDALSSNQPDCEQANNSVENPVPDETQPLVVDEVKIRVSSKHLTLASRYFKSRLCGCWSEGAILESDGYVVVPVYCSNSNALFILLRIIHCQTREVPREVDLQMLCDIAVLVDFYDLYDAVEFFSSLWIDNLMSKGPAFSSTYRNNPAMEKLIVQWVWVSYAFGYRTIFRQTTERVFRNSLGPMERYGLPIPNKVVGKKPRHTSYYNTL